MRIKIIRSDVSVELNDVELENPITIGFSGESWYVSINIWDEENGDDDDNKEEGSLPPILFERRN